MELLVQTDLTVVNQQEIAFNEAELRAELTAYLDKYNGLAVTDDNIPEAKAARADVNKVRKAIDDAKKRVKQAFTAPYTRFESSVKELLSMCDSVSGDIDAGIKEYEAAAKEAKRKSLLDYFQKGSTAISEYAAFEDVFDPRWLGSTFKAAEAEKAIDTYIASLSANVEALHQIEAEPNVKAMLESQFKRTKSLSDVLRLKNEIDQRVKAEEERARIKAEEEKARTEALKDDSLDALTAYVSAPDLPQFEASSQEPSLIGTTQDTITETAQTNPSVEMTSVTIKVYTTNGAIDALYAYLDASNIMYEEVF